MKIIVLGSGTSNGVPVIGCDCEVCTSTDIRDKRTRSSVYLEINNTKIVIDTGPDFRRQYLDNNLSDLDLILITHSHYDHIAGLDEVRTINLLKKKRISLYAGEDAIDNIQNVFPYIFKPPMQLGGGVPQIDFHSFTKFEGFHFNEIEIIPLAIKHGNLDIFAFRIEDFAYITDASFIPVETIKKLKNLKVLFLNSLRIKPHSTHINLETAVDYARKIGAKTTYLTHISHNISHQEIQNNLPENIFLAYDGIKIEY